jgi:hypothetical protein
MYFFVFMEYAYILYLKYDIIFFVFFVFLIYNMFILFSCSIFKQVISYIIEGNLIYVHKYSRSVYIRTSPFCISIFFNIYYPHTEIHKYDPAIYIPVLSIFALLPSVFQFSSISIILILKYINMNLLFIFLFCLYSYFLCMYTFLHII